MSYGNETGKTGHLEVAKGRLENERERTELMRPKQEQQQGKGYAPEDLKIINKRVLVLITRFRPPAIDGLN